ISLPLALPFAGDRCGPPCYVTSLVSNRARRCYLSRRASRTCSSTTARNCPRAGCRITSSSPSTTIGYATSRPSSVSPFAKDTTRRQGGGSAASTHQWRVTPSAQLSGTKKRPAAARAHIRRKDGFVLWSCCRCVHTGSTTTNRPRFPGTGLMTSCGVKNPVADRPWLSKLGRNDICPRRSIMSSMLLNLSLAVVLAPAPADEKINLPSGPPPKIVLAVIKDGKCEVQY